MRFALLSILLLSASAIAAPERVLFVGNSFTYYNNSLHNHYRALVRASLPDNRNRVRSMTISGGKLYEHAGLEAMVNSEQWDIVILQGHSLGPIDGAEPFREAAKKHSKAIRQAGAEPMLYMTWAYTDRPEMTAQLDAAYTSLGAEINAEVAPAGLAFERVTEERPELALRTEDQRHPTLAGTYLAACVFYAALQDRTPEDIDYDAGLDDEVAAYLQGVAWDVVQAYGTRDE
ncbi:MAG: hypothetical protein QNJ05_03695 [Woeseiaceae bacterium]|nr:hypothetical protein [Woeseiaceae bacterium]